MADLVQLLGSLHGPGGRISVPGFNSNVRPQLMDLAWQGLEDSEEFSMSSYRCVERLCGVQGILQAQFPAEFCSCWFSAGCWHCCACVSGDSFVAFSAGFIIHMGMAIPTVCLHH